MSSREKRIYLSSPTMNGHEKRFVDEAFETNWIAPMGPNVAAFGKDQLVYQRHMPHHIVGRGALERPQHRVVGVKGLRHRRRDGRGPQRPQGRAQGGPQNGQRGRTCGRPPGQDGRGHHRKVLTCPPARAKKDCGRRCAPQSFCVPRRFTGRRCTSGRSWRSRPKGRRPSRWRR